MGIFGAFEQTSEYQSETQAARLDAEKTARQTVRARGPADVAMRVERALIACEAMWSILREKLGVTDLELIDRINQLDLTDGRLDGKISKSAVACPQCGRTIARRQPQCTYCGQPIMHDPFA